MADRSGTSADEDANRWIVKANNIQYSIDRNYAVSLTGSFLYLAYRHASALNGYIYTGTQTTTIVAVVAAKLKVPSLV